MLLGTVLFGVNVDEVLVEKGVLTLVNYFIFFLVYFLQPTFHPIAVRGIFPVKSQLKTFVKLIAGIMDGFLNNELRFLGITVYTFLFLGHFKFALERVVRKTSFLLCIT